MKPSHILTEYIYKNIFDEGHELKVCEGLLQFRQENIQSTINKWAKDLNFTKEDTEVQSKQQERYSLSFTTGKWEGTVMT